MELTQVLAPEHLRLRRAEIRSPELETPGQRALEASLFIDKKFLDVSVVTGEKTPPEFLFGEREWKSYLDARKHARQYGNGNLTVDFITAIHKKAANGRNEANPGLIRNVSVYGGTYNDPQNPVEYTDQELESIVNNPYLLFKQTEKNKGFILYPGSRDGGRIDANITTLLQEVCDWYNLEIKKPDTDPYKLAAILQRKIISIHPFADVNGTTSRILMNWSLENQGKPPSALDNPSNDILTPEAQWVDAVRKGSNKYKESERRLRALEKTGVNDISYVLGLGPEQAFYDYIFKYIMPPPSFFTVNGMQDHAKFEEFFQNFLTELSKFQLFLQANQQIGTETITQGGLISRAFVELTRRNTAVQDANLEFTDTRVYRGGRLTDYNQVTDETVLDIMSTFTAIESGYWPLSKTGSASMSAKKIPSGHIADGMEYYNQLVANAYFEKARPNGNPYTNIPKLRQVINDHIGHPTNESPFASTSLSASVSHQWATGKGYGVLVEARLPKEGVVMTYSGVIEGAKGITGEMECLVAGGLNPDSIERTVVFKGNNPVILATRTGQEIVISDLTGDFVIKRIYRLSNGKYKLVSTEKTQEKALDVAFAERESYGTSSKLYGWEVGMNEKPPKKIISLDEWPLDITPKKTPHEEISNKHLFNIQNSADFDMLGFNELPKEIYNKSNEEYEKYDKYSFSSFDKTLFKKTKIEEEMNIFFKSEKTDKW